MADALAYAVDKLDPDVLVDVATLTGAMKVALGQQVGGYFANNDALAAAHPRGRRRGRRAAVAVPAGRRLRGEAVLARSPTPTTPPAARARSPRRCSSSTSSASVPVGPPRHRLGRRRPGRQLRVDQGPDRLRRPRAARLARQPEPLEGHHDEGPDRPLVPRRRPRGRRGRARDVRRRHLARQVHRHGRLQLQDLADARRASGSRALRLRVRRGPRGVPGDLHRRRRRRARLEDDRQRAGPDRGVRHRRGRRGLGRLRSASPRA